MKTLDKNAKTTFKKRNSLIKIVMSTAMPFIFVYSCHKHEKSHMDLNLLLASSAIAEAVATAGNPNCIPEIGCNTVKAANDWSEIQVGELPIIITAPHGGSLLPAEMKTRTTGTLGNDSNTADLAIKIRDELQKFLGKRPHLILNHLDRSKIDMNRSTNQAVDDENDPDFQTNLRAYTDFHRFINLTRTHIAGKFTRGILVDIHGHAQDENIVQIGLDLTEAELESNENNWATNNLHRSSSLRALVENGNMTLKEAILGNDAVGTLLEEKGFPSFPNRQLRNFATTGTNHYFTGGYNTATYGSGSGGRIDSFQMETPGPNLRNTENTRADFAKKFAESFVQFLRRANYPGIPQS
ncbi:hypothetical protein LFX25_03965 [Leptospira sp. FAT2]|uniref:hypothetical protein n=1 Tax=Leptospira sanjuanensis TaxID=2879643 RepID=UPI001EE8E2E1|nr:hypothetical protein [Leptospira sanjuanensis]MCG6192393.1 hypothetical protein [Leptospira sanjuanensis]